jgi:hypothetical protein
MTDNAMKKIEAIEPRKGYRIAITWEDNGQMILSLAEDIRRGGVFEALRDERLFAKVRIGQRRRSIEWPEPKDENGEPIIGIDADALFQLAGQQKTASSFRRLMTIMQEQVANGTRHQTDR